MISVGLVVGDDVEYGFRVSLVISRFTRFITTIVIKNQVIIVFLKKILWINWTFFKKEINEIYVTYWSTIQSFIRITYFN